MVIYKYTKENNNRKGEIYMLNDEICKLRDKLNKSIEQGEDYAITYKLSIELDELYSSRVKLSLGTDLFGQKLPRGTDLFGNFLNHIKKYSNIMFYVYSQLRRICK